jgi:hypothetical protein
LLGRLGITPAGCDLVVDLGAVSAGNASAAAITAGAVLPALPHLQDWRSLTLAAASFPEDLSSIPTDSIDTIRRDDWLVWHGLVVRAQSLPRLPAFSDYAISHPTPFDADPRLIRPSSNIRYTADDHWLIVKGRSLKHFGFDQFHGDSTRLMARPEWRGADHCWACGAIAACAARSGGTGNQTTWRAIGTHHHLVVVCDQLRLLP